MPPGADCHYPDVALSLVDANLILPFYALNPNLFLIKSSNSPQTAPIVRTRFGLNPKTGMDPSPQSPNNKFVKCGIKSYSGSRTKILGYSIRRKELYIHIRTKKYPRTCPNAMILEYFQSPFPFSFLHLIYYGFFTFFSIHVWIRRSKFFFSIPPAFS